MLAKPLIWLKDKHKKSSSHEGIVVGNNDPLKLGRVQVRVSKFHGTTDLEEHIPDEDLPWISQRPSSGLGSSSSSAIFMIPEIGSKVIVDYPTSEQYFGYYKSGSTTLETRTEEFDEDYPNTYGMVDSSGNKFKINKTQKTFEYLHPSGNKIRINSDTSMEITHHTGSSFKINSDGSITINTTLLTINSPNTLINGHLEVTSDAVIGGKSFLGHKHTEQGDGSPTSSPI